MNNIISSKTIRNGEGIVHVSRTIECKNAILQKVMMLYVMIVMSDCNWYRIIKNVINW